MVVVQEPAHDSCVFQTSYIYIYIMYIYILDWIGLERPSAKRQTPDLRRHPSHHLRTRCNVLRLEIKQAPAPAQRAGKRKAAAAAPAQVDTQPRTQPRKLATTTERYHAGRHDTTRIQAKPKQNTLDQIGGAVAHALSDFGPRSRAGNRPYSHRLQTVRRRVCNGPYTLHIER